MNMCIFEAISNFFLTDGFPLPFVLRFFFKKKPFDMQGECDDGKRVWPNKISPAEIIRLRSIIVMIRGYIKHFGLIPVWLARNIYFIILYRPKGRFYFIYQLTRTGPGFANYRKNQSKIKPANAILSFFPKTKFRTVYFFKFFQN